jgi:hypothetical protein
MSTDLLVVRASHNVALVLKSECVQGYVSASYGAEQTSDLQSQIRRECAISLFPSVEGGMPMREGPSLAVRSALTARPAHKA